MADASRAWRSGLALALLLAASTAAPQGRPAAPPRPGAQPPPQPAAPAPPGGAARGPADAPPQRLGRKYPVPSEQTIAPREPPQVYVGVVSPAEPSVHQKTGRFRRGRTGDVGGAGGAGNPGAGGMR